MVSSKGCKGLGQGYLAAQLSSMPLCCLITALQYGGAAGGTCSGRHCKGFHDAGLQHKTHRSITVLLPHNALPPATPPPLTIFLPGTMGLRSPSLRMFSAITSAPASPKPTASSAQIL